MNAAALFAGASAFGAVMAAGVLAASWSSAGYGTLLSRGEIHPGALAREVLREAFATEDAQSIGPGSRQPLVVAAIAAFLGFSLLGLPGAVVGAIVGPFLRARLQLWRQARRAAQIDEGCTELALALSSALAAGNSVRGALLAAGPALEGPVREEVDKLAVDLTLGMSVEDAMAALRDRTRSTRVEAVAGALALHRGSGGDLVMLMRELAASFRGRDRALRDAQTASVQARYTAAVVAAIPIAAAGLCELIAPGSIVGAISFLPSGVLLSVALLGVIVGVTACWRVGR